MSCFFEGRKSRNERRKSVSLGKNWLKKEKIIILLRKNYLLLHKFFIKHPMHIWHCTIIVGGVVAVRGMM